MKELNISITTLAVAALLAGCDQSGNTTPPPPAENGTAMHDEEEHEHDEVPLGKFDIGGITVGAGQGHGAVEAGKEGHLVIKLPYQDQGATVLRAWIGIEDRTLSSVGKGEYAASHDDYDIHVVAPDPLPEGTGWWLEIEKPDGTRAVGSFPLLKDLAADN